MIQTSGAIAGHACPHLGKHVVMVRWTAAPLPLLAPGAGQLATGLPGSHSWGVWRSRYVPVDRRSRPRSEPEPVRLGLTHVSASQAVVDTGGGRCWIRTSEAFATVLQTAPFGRSGNLPLAPGRNTAPAARIAVRPGRPATGYGQRRRHTRPQTRSNRSWQPTHRSTS